MTYTKFVKIGLSLVIQPKLEALILTKNELTYDLIYFIESGKLTRMTCDLTCFIY